MAVSNNSEATGVVVVVETGAQTAGGLWELTWWGTTVVVVEARASAGLGHRAMTPVCCEPSIVSDIRAHEGASNL